MTKDEFSWINTYQIVRNLGKYTTWEKEKEKKNKKINKY